MAISINIIHSSEDTKRMELLKQELEKQNITEYNLWESVYDERSIQASISRAHKQIVEWAKDEGLEEIIIMEDDIKFTHSNSFKYYLEHKPNDYDIYLAGIFLGTMNEDDVVNRFTGMTCYCVHKRFYNTFLNVNEKEHIDIALSNLGKYVVCNPFVVTQYNGFSSNTQRYENYEAIFSNRKLYNG